MTKWDYRVVKTTWPQAWSDDTTPDVRIGIHEVYYAKNGRPIAYAENPTTVEWTPNGSGEEVLKRIKKALKLPILSHEDFHESEE